MAQLLVEKSQIFPQQLIAITHNPTLAAAACTHVIIRKIHHFKTSDQQSLLLSKKIRSNTTAEISSSSISNLENQQFISINVIQNDPYHENRIQELVRMVCGSSDNETFNSQAKATENNADAITFVKSLIRCLCN